MTGLTADQVTEVAQAILNFEARRDSHGHLAVYRLPPDDGGGTYEVAGINERYDTAKAAQLKALVEDGQYEEAERQAVAYYIANTTPVSQWRAPAAVEAYLRDTMFNRGFGGAAHILQGALGVSSDGHVGPLTHAALEAQAGADEGALLTRLREARERYERVVVGRDESSHFWRGLVNRWDNALKMARRFLPPAPLNTPATPAKGN